MRNGHIGYINQRLYTDIKSYEVFKEGDKLFAVQIEKIQACKPEYVPGGFAGHCTNQEEVWGGNETKEVGEPFRLEKKYGVYGHTIDNANAPQVFRTEAEAEEAKRRVETSANDREFEILPIYDEDGNSVKWFELVGYPLTKTGRRQRRFVRLGEKIEKDCRYYYDYNF